GSLHHRHLLSFPTRRSSDLIKKNYPDVIVVADTCLCEYTSHGHCGIIENEQVLNDPSLELLAKTAVSQAEAGADIIAPSNMMDRSEEHTSELQSRENLVCRL